MLRTYGLAPGSQSIVDPFQELPKEVLIDRQVVLFKPQLFGNPFDCVWYVVNQCKGQQTDDLLQRLDVRPHPLDHRRRVNLILGARI